PDLPDSSGHLRARSLPKPVVAARGATTAVGRCPDSGARRLALAVPVILGILARDQRRELVALALRPVADDQLPSSLAGEVAVDRVAEFFDIEKSAGKFADAWQAWRMATAGKQDRAMLQQCPAMPALGTAGNLGSVQD